MEKGPESSGQVGLDRSVNKVIQATQLEEELKQSEVRIEKLEKKLHNLMVNSQRLEEYLKGRNKIYNDLVENQNISKNMQAIAKEEITVLEESSTDLQEDHKKEEKVFEDVILKLENKRQDLETSVKQTVSRDSNRRKELTELVTLKNNELSGVKVWCDQFRKEIERLDQLIHGRNIELEENRVAIQDCRRKHDEETTNLSDTLVKVKSDLNSIQEENYKLETEIHSDSRRYEQLLAEYEALETVSKKRMEQVNDLESHIEKIKERHAKKKEEFDDLKKTHLAKVLEKELKFEDYRKQRQDLEQNNKETTNKLVERNSENKKLSDSVAQRIRFNEELMKKSQTQDSKLQRIAEDLKKSSDLYNELSIKSAQMDKNLMDKKKLRSQIETDLKVYATEENVISENDSELRAKLNITKCKLQDELKEISNFLDKTQTEKDAFFAEIEKLKQNLVEKNHQLDELKNNNETILQETERNESDSTKKLQKIKDSIAQYEEAGYDIQIQEQSAKINELGDKIAGEKLKYQQENLKIDEADRKQKQEQESQLKETKSNIANIEKEIIAIKRQGEELAKKLDEAQASHAAVFDDSNVSELVGVIYGKHKSLPTSSTPQNSPVVNQQIVDFGFGSSSDLSSIDDSHTDFDRAQRHYNEFLRKNRTDNAKLSQAGKKNKFGKL